MNSSIYNWLDMLKDILFPSLLSISQQTKERNLFVQVIHWTVSKIVQKMANTLA
jgi:hypothetical protein